MISKKPHNRASVLLVAISEYDDPAYGELEKVPMAAKKLANVLIEGGYNHAYPELLKGGDKYSVEPLINEWLTKQKDQKRMILYWTGHGKKVAGGGHFLVLKDTPSNKINNFNAIKTADLGLSLAQSSAEKILVLLDTCFSGGGAADIATTLFNELKNIPPIQGVERAFSIISSAHSFDKITDGTFSNALVDVFNNPSVNKTWSDNDEYIEPVALAAAVKNLLDNQGIKQSIERLEKGIDIKRFIPNPRYWGAQPAEDVETKRLWFTMPEAEEHFLPASRGIDIGSFGWYFTGRERLLIELVKWLKNADHGMMVVTGPAGSGKSAVMGRVAILSDPHYRKMAESVQDLSKVPVKTLPPEGIIDVAVHAKGKTLADCVEAIATALDITLPAKDRTDPMELIETVKGSKRRITILLDALDEAKPGHHYSIGSRLLKPLSSLSQVRVLVGVRRSPDGATIPEGEPRHARLRKLFGDSARILDLEDELKTEEDIAEYARKRLMDSRHQNDPAGVDRVSKMVAEKAAGIFLYARVVVRTLEEVEDLDEKLPKDALDAFVNDITRRFGDRADMVDEMLCALAWGEGKGLSREIWAPVANALSKSGAHYTDDDVMWILKHAGWHVIEAGEDGQAVYRLPHQALADYFHNLFEEIDANARITQTLCEGIAGKDWLNTDPYLWRHLASHAAIAGLLGRLITDPGYLAVAEPAKLVPVLSKVTKPKKAIIIAFMYRMVAGHLHTADHLERMALIHLTTKQEHPALADAVEPPIAPAWRCRWASWQPSDPHLTFTSHKGPVTSVAIGEVDGSPVVVSGSDDTTIRLWDACSGRALGEPFTGHDNSVTSVAIGDVDGSPVVLSGGWDNKVRLWDARSGHQIGEPLTGHESPVTSIAIGEVDGSPVVVSGGLDSTVRLWDARSGRALGEPLTGHEGPVFSVAIGKIDGSPVVVSGSGDKTVRLWDARNGRALQEPLAGHEEVVHSVAIGEVDGSPVVVSGSGDKTVRLWDAHSGHPILEPLIGHEDSIYSVAIGEVDGSPVVVSGGLDSTVRLWDARTGHQLGEPFTGHENSVFSVAIGKVDGSMVVVSGSHDKSVRLWDTCSGRALGEPLTGHEGSINSVAIGKVDGSPVVVSGGLDSTVRLWDARSGRALGEPLTGHEGPVFSVAIGKIDGSPVVASGGMDNTVRLWDACSGRAMGEPLTGHEGWVSSVAIGEVDGSPVVASGGMDNTVRLWDARSGRALGEPLTGHEESVNSVAIGEVDGSPVVVSGGWDNKVRLWDACSGRALGEPLIGHEGPVKSVAIGEVDGSPMVVSGGMDNKVRLWDARSGRALGEPLTGHEDWVNTVAIIDVDGSPVVASGGDDTTVRLWDARTGQALRMIPSLRSTIAKITIAENNGIVVGTRRGILMFDIARFY